MAYLDFREAELSGSPQVSLIAPQVENPVVKARFSALEWLVIALAQRDTVRSLRTPSRFGRMVARLFGTRSESPLADLRLEALRRLAVFAWRDSFNVPPSELKAFRDAGFSTDHTELLLESVLAGRSRDAAGRAPKLVQCKMVGQTAES